MNESFILKTKQHIEILDKMRNNLLLYVGRGCGKSHTIYCQIESLLAAKLSLTLTGSDLEMEDWILKSEPSYRYQLLSRMKQDCDYYLGYGNRSTNHLWAGDVPKQIQAMKDIWNSFPDEDKPEWLTWEELIEYEEKMNKE